MREGGMSESAGKMLLIIGGLLMVAGTVFLLAQRVPFLGKLPGDIRYESDGTTVYIPLTTCIVLSVLLTVIVNLLMRVLGR
jgi:hypothetical protein